MLNHLSTSSGVVAQVRYKHGGHRGVPRPRTMLQSDLYSFRGLDDAPASSAPAGVSVFSRRCFSAISINKSATAPHKLSLDRSNVSRSVTNRLSPLAPKALVRMYPVVPNEE